MRVSVLIKWGYVIGGGLLVATGCGRSRPTQFYLLAPVIAPAERESASGHGTRVFGIAPIELPPYLNRAEFVTRTGNHGLRVAEFHRWAEPLDDAVGRTLVENLARLRPSDRFVLLPWTGGSAPPVNRLWLEVLRFERGPDGQVQLEARWMVTAGESKELVPFTTTEVRIPSEAPEYNATAAAMSRALGELAEIIAAALPSKGPVP